MPRFERLLSESQVSVSDMSRPAYARDLWPQFQLDRLAGQMATPPQIILWPTTVTEVAAVVALCADEGLPIVPFGAGSGVCGGTATGQTSVVIDLKRLKKVRDFDGHRCVVDVESGLNGERFERYLNRRGFSLGHFPSSILCSTVGGWVATRSAGQCSSRYGKIEDMVVDLEVVTADGKIHRTPRDGGALDWNQVFIGSEGTLGIITASRLMINPLPESRSFRGWLMPNIGAGIEMMRQTMVAGLRPAVMRMYDPLDTKMVGSDPNKPSTGLSGKLKSLASGGSGPGGIKHAALRSVLSWSSVSNRIIRTWDGPVLLVTMAEGSVAETQATEELMMQFAKASGGIDQGEAPGKAWLAHRYDVSFKQSRIYRAGCFVDTFEVATTWDRVESVYEAVRRAMASEVVVMAHFSHVYPGGCSIYFTMAGSGSNPEKMRMKYRAAWQAGLSAANASGAALAHHHGVGISRIDHMAKANGSATSVFHALKAALDPQGIMNPGKVMK